MSPFRFDNYFEFSRAVSLLVGKFSTEAPSHNILVLDVSCVGPDNFWGWNHCRTQSSHTISGTLLRNQSSNLSLQHHRVDIFSQKCANACGFFHKYWTYNKLALPGLQNIACEQYESIFQGKKKKSINWYIGSFEIELTLNTNNENLSPVPFHAFSEAQIIAMSASKYKTLFIVSSLWYFASH